MLRRDVLSKPTRYIQWNGIFETFENFDIENPELS
jgi:hypothetical protein